MTQNNTITSRMISDAYDVCLKEYPESYLPILEANRTRLTWQLETLVKHVPVGGNLLDIGAGIVPFMLIAARLGYTCTIVDDLADNTYASEDTQAVLNMFEKDNVKVVNGDAFTGDQSGFANENYDLVTSHDSLEHWHNSPKTLL